MPRCGSHRSHIRKIRGSGCSDPIPTTTTGPGGSSQAGGQTSEFGGTGLQSGYCPEKKVTPVDITSAKLESWIVAIEGEHELPLGWKLESPPGSIKGFDEFTMLSGEDDFITEHRLFMMNTGIQHLEQNPTTGEFDIVDTNINDPESG